MTTDVQDTIYEIADYQTGQRYSLKPSQIVTVVSFVQSAKDLRVTAIPQDLGMQCCYSQTARDLLSDMAHEPKGARQCRVFYLYDCDEFRAITL